MTESKAFSFLGLFGYVGTSALPSTLDRPEAQPCINPQNFGNVGNIGLQRQLLTKRAGVFTSNRGTMSNDHAYPPLPSPTLSRTSSVLTRSRDTNGDVPSKSSGAAKQLLKRGGEKLRRTASKLSLASLIDDAASIRSFSSSHGGRSAHSSVKKGRIKPADISAPTDFEHITHTEPHQHVKHVHTNQSLREYVTSATESDLIAEMSAIRASQHSRQQLHRIKANDLHSRTSSVETPVTSPSVSYSSRSSAMISSDSITSYGSSLNQSPIDFDRGSVRSRRSSSSFSRPFNVKQSDLPLRVSSKRATTSHGSKKFSQHPAGSALPLSSHQMLLTTGLADSVSGLRTGFEEEASAIFHPPTAWGFPSYGSSVDMELNRSRDSKSHLRVSTRPESPDSARTVTPISAAHAGHNGEPPPMAIDERIIATPSSPKSKRPASLQRSSVHGGLFSSWSLEDETSQSHSGTFEFPVVLEDVDEEGESASERQQVVNQQTGDVTVISSGNYELQNHTLPQPPKTSRKRQKRRPVESYSSLEHKADDNAPVKSAIRGSDRIWRNSRERKVAFEEVDLVGGEAVAPGSLIMEEPLTPEDNTVVHVDALQTISKPFKASASKKPSKIPVGSSSTSRQRKAANALGLEAGLAREQSFDIPTIAIPPRRSHRRSSGKGGSKDGEQKNHWIAPHTDT